MEIPTTSNAAQMADFAASIKDAISGKEHLEVAIQNQFTHSPLSLTPLPENLTTESESTGKQLNHVFNCNVLESTGEVTDNQGNTLGWVQANGNVTIDKEGKGDVVASLDGSGHLKVEENSDLGKAIKTGDQRAQNAKAPSYQDPADFHAQVAANSEAVNELFS